MQSICSPKALLPFSRASLIAKMAIKSCMWRAHRPNTFFRWLQARTETLISRSTFSSPAQTTIISHRPMEIFYSSYSIKWTIQSESRLILLCSLHIFWKGVQFVLKRYIRRDILSYLCYGLWNKAGARNVLNSAVLRERNEWSMIFRSELTIIEDVKYFLNNLTCRLYPTSTVSNSDEVSIIMI